MAKPDISAARLRELLNYDPESGQFTWRVQLGTKIQPGARAGHRCKSGYVRIRIEGRQFAAHRLAWLHTHGEWPVDEVDHVNRIKHDNRIANLRDVSRLENEINKPSRSATGVRGVFFRPAYFSVEVYVDGMPVRRGPFDTLAEAVRAKEQILGENPQTRQ